MKEYNKRILLSVTGMSPAVVTETLYALVTEKGFIPTEIQVITTEQGKNKLLNALLGIEGGRKERKGALQEFIEDYGEQYGFSDIHFDESCVHIIRDENGSNLPDIRTPEENEFAANNIVQLVGSLCQNEDTVLHVSIAGGRKTMGFFMGYALSLYGREQDNMSHVLVSEEYENVPSFYYPKPYSHPIYDRNGKELDAKDGKVMLAEIPWVRLGLGVPERLKDKTISYSQSVKNAQALLEKPSLKFLSPIEECRVNFGSKTIRLSPRGYSLLLGLVISKNQGWDFRTQRCKDLSNEDNDKDIERTKALYVKIYNDIKGYPEYDKNANKNSKREPIEQTMKYGLSQLFADSRNNIKDNVEEHFSLGKGTKNGYVPSTKNKACRFELNINTDDIDLSEIHTELVCLKLF